MNELSLFSQENDSGDAEKPKHIYLFKNNEFNTGDTSFARVDTVLDRVQIYTNRNNLGNNGLPHVSLTPNFLPELGFNYAPNHLVYYGFVNSQVSYYNTTAPYTELFYVLGAKKEQDFKAIHTQNVNKNLNFAATLKRVRSDGFYQSQTTNHNAFNLSSNYKSPNQRYCLLSNMIYNSLKYAENGGIRNDTTFENGNTTDKRLIAVNLASAQQKIRERSFYLKQYINLGDERDEKINDSTTIKKLIPKSSLSHSILVNDHSRLYSDNEQKGSVYYANFYNDTTKTNDSLYYWKVENELMWETVKRETDEGKQRLGGSVGIQHNYVELRQYVYSGGTKNNTYDTALNNLIVGGRLFNYGKNQKFSFDTYFKYVVKGYSENGYDCGLTLKKSVRNEFNYLQLKGAVKNQLPDFFYQHYTSNHFVWHNQFYHSKIQYIDLCFISKKLFFEAGASVIQYQNFIYLDYTASPKQLTQNLKIASVFLNKDFHFRKLTFSNKIIYQKALDSNVIKIPELITYQSLFISLDLFKKALHTNIGVDIFYNSLYYANAYNPATMQFYLQDTKQIGNYPYVDFFISMKIRSARIFLKYEHVNSGLMDNSYYAAPNYPMPDRAFKFGIDWKVFN